MPDPHITFLDKDLYLSARIESTWLFVMHDLLGYQDYCDSTTQFEWISYAYTKDAPLEVQAKGEALWKHLMCVLAGHEKHGQLVGLSQAPMSTVTRRRALWDK